MSARALPTFADREARRAMYRDRAIRRAARTEVSMVCLTHHFDAPEPGPPYVPTACVGLRGCGPAGCLCPCHDAVIAGEIVAEAAR
jgi:hypothetical protein